MPLFWLSLAYLCGVLLGALLAWPVGYWLILAALAFLALPLRLLLRRTSLAQRFPIPSLPAFPLDWQPFLPPATPLLLVALAFGGARWQAEQPHLSPDFVAWYNDQESEFVLKGVITAPPDLRDGYTNLQVEVEEIRKDGEWPFLPVRGLVLARVQPGDEWRYGDRVALFGALQTPPEDDEFSYREYLARHGIYAYLPRGNGELLARDQGNPLLAGIYALKMRSLKTVYLIFPDPEASLMAGILLGVESGIPAPVDQAFIETGTSHVIAISGTNITLVAGLLATLFGRILGRRWGALAATMGIAGYTILVGADAAVVRAALMGGLSLFARQVGGRQDGLNSLAIVAAVMGMMNPAVLWDVGFQLSFMATLGLVLYAGPFSQAFTRLASQRLPEEVVRRLAGPVGEYLLFTLAAQLTTLPVTLYHFQRLSLVSVLANPVILPAQPPVMILGGLALILGLLSPALGSLASWLAWPFVAYTIHAVELFARLPGGTLPLAPVGLPLVVGFYALLFGWTFARSQMRSLLPLIKPSLAVSCLGVMAVIAWRAVLAAPDGRLHLTVFDVGGGEAVFIQGPAGQSVLVGGGGRASLLSDALGRRLPPFRRRLDLLVVAAVEDTRIGALPRGLERFPPVQVLWAGRPYGTRSAHDLQKILDQNKTPVVEAQVGQVLDLGGGSRLSVVALGERGATLLLEWERFRVLLPVGLDKESLPEVQAASLAPLTALLLVDGGYAPLNPPEWIDALQPQLLLLSAAPNDRRGLPSPETLQAAKLYPLLRTDHQGWIHLSTDGQQLWVEVEHE